MKTTKKDFECFKKACKEYQDKWHLGGWDLVFLHSKCGDAYATTAKDLEAMNATITFCIDWGKETLRSYNKKQIKLIAKHEMLHILLGRLSELGQYRYLQYRELEQAEHEVIKKLLILL